jgi:hypothetical protein
MNKIPYSIAGGLLILGATAPIVTANDYFATAGQTHLTVREQFRNNETSGFYYTIFQGQQWAGGITINRIEGGAGQALYSGTFNDRSLNPQSSQSCTGDIQIDRTGAHDVAPEVTLQVKWTVKGGKNCPSDVGTVFSMRLVEVLPKADRNGNYTIGMNVRNQESDGTHTWPNWQVIGPNGKLNCRDTPNATGKVTFTYKAGDRLNTRGKPVDALKTAADGTNWLRVSAKQCFVPAIDRAVKPISISF